MKLQISSSQLEYLREAAAAAPDVEVCGLALGRDGRLERLVPARNVAADPARSFEIDPATLLATHRNARGEGLRVIGHWHSHPNGRAQPSARDAARASENGQIWLIIAGDAITAWAARTDGRGPAHFEPVRLEVA